MSSRLHTLQLALTCLALAGCGDDAATAESQSGGDESSTSGGSDTAPTGITVTVTVTDGLTTSSSSSEGSTDAGSTGTGGTSSGETGSSSEDTGRTSSTSGSTSSGSSSSGDSGTTGSSSSSSSESTGGDTGAGMTDDPGFVGLSTGDAFAVFDIVTELAVGGTSSLLPEADYPYDANMTPDGSEVWFVGASGDGIVAVDTVSSQVVASATLSAANPYPVDVVFTADGATAFVASRDDASLTAFDVATHTEQMTFATPGGNDAGKMALNPCTGQIYVVEWFGGDLMTYDPAMDTWSSVTVGGSLWDVAVHPDGSTVYVTDRSGDVLHVFDVSMTGGEPVSVPDMSVAVGDDPWGIDITSDGGTVIVASEDSSQVHLVDTTTFATVAVALPDGASSRDVDINPADTLAFVPSGNIDGDDGVFVLDIAGETVSNTISITGGSNPNVVAVAPQLVTCAE